MLTHMPNHLAGSTRGPTANRHSARLSNQELWKPQLVATLREGVMRKQQQKGQKKGQWFVVIQGKEGILLSNTGCWANIVEKMNMMLW